ncbi:MAG: acyl-CoA dehydrogenase family protein [Planctomycetota bacterium]|nr:acyl-CoA dehydrogenase family protein [Planctomycetota bacterium]
MRSKRMDHYLESLLGEERFDLYRSISRYADDEIADQLLGWERSKVLIPDEVIAQFSTMGLFGLPIPEAHGGQGGGLTDLLLAGLALSYQSQSVAITVGAAVSLGASPVLRFGSDKQKLEHLPDLAAGNRMFAFGLSEPGRGSDAANPEVVAEQVGDHFVIRGEKCWSTNAAWASHVVVHALTDPDGRNGHRSTCFIIPRDREGVQYQEMEGKMVWPLSSTGSIAFDSVEVSRDEILGDFNEGFHVMATTLNGGRLFVASLALGSLAFALDKVRHYVQERDQFGGPIGRFQRVQDVILEMDIVLERNLTWLIALGNRYDDGTMEREQAAKLKIDSSRAVSSLLLEAMEVCGGVACLDEFGLARHAADLFVTRVGEGSNRALMTQAVRPLLPDIVNQLQ